MSNYISSLNFYTVGNLTQYTNIDKTDGIVTTRIAAPIASDDTIFFYPSGSAPRMVKGIQQGKYLLEEFPYHFKLKNITTEGLLENKLDTQNPHFILCTKEKSSSTSAINSLLFCGLLFVNKSARQKLIDSKFSIEGEISTSTILTETSTFFTTLSSNFKEGDKVYFCGRTSNYASNTSKPSQSFYGLLLKIINDNNNYNFLVYPYSSFGQNGANVGTIQWDTKENKCVLQQTEKDSSVGDKEVYNTISPFDEEEDIYLFSISAVAKRREPDSSSNENLNGYIVGQISLSEEFFKGMPWETEIIKQENIALEISNTSSDAQEYSGNEINYPTPKFVTDEGVVADKYIEEILSEPGPETNAGPYENDYTYENNYIYTLKASDITTNETKQPVTYYLYNNNGYESDTGTTENLIIENTIISYNYKVNNEVISNNTLTVPVTLTILPKEIQLVIDLNKCIADENGNSHSFTFSDIVTGNSGNLPLAISFTSGGTTYNSQITINRDTNKTEYHEKSVSGQFIGSTSNINYHVNNADATLTVRFARQQEENPPVADPSKYVNVVEIDNNFKPENVKQDEIIWNTILKYNGYFEQIEKVLNQIVKALNNDFTKDSNNTNK